MLYTHDRPPLAWVLVLMNLIVILLIFSFF